MTAISIEAAQAQLPDLIGKLAPGEQVVILSGQQVVARLIGEASIRPAHGADNCQDLAPTRAGDAVPGPAHELTRRLVAAGLLKEIKSPDSGDASYRERRPAKIAGDPLSKTIIDERR